MLHLDFLWYSTLLLDLSIWSKEILNLSTLSILLNLYSYSLSFSGLSLLFFFGNGIYQLAYSEPATVIQCHVSRKKNSQVHIIYRCQVLCCEYLHEWSVQGTLPTGLYQGSAQNLSNVMLRNKEYINHSFKRICGNWPENNCSNLIDVKSVSVLYGVHDF